jgi:GH24 family phage-related lysozyme (muramidase)
LLQSVRDYWITFNDPLEGRVHFMYLDQKGWVSTGIGNNIDETAAANSPPSAAERAASLAEANELRWLDEAGSEATANAQLATLSMCWAPGPAFQFPRFQGHVAVRDWNGAADEFHFNPDVGTIMIRNKLDRSHFLLAQAVENQGLPPQAIALDLSDVFGVQGALITLGYKPGRQDGADGPSTQGAGRAFQSDNGLDQNGAFNDPSTVSALGSQLSDRGFTVLGG